MSDLRPVLLVVGVLLATLGCAMMLPALYDLAAGHDDWRSFAAAAGITLFVGIGLAFSTRGTTGAFSIKQAFLMTNLVWLALTAFGALPMAWSTLDLSYTDAFFEAMSGITTTGATVIVGLDTAPPGVLLWRGLLQWLGGLGIIVMAISVMPLLQVGGMQLFRIEAFDTAGKVLPRAAQIAGYLCLLYAVFTSICAVSYVASGMDVFDAAVHAMTTIATGGFSTRDASIGAFDSAPIEIVGSIFMIVGSLPFVLYLHAISGNPRALYRDTQVRWFFAAVLGFSVLAVIAHQRVMADPGGSKLLDAVFNVISIMTGTGYSTTDYDNWSEMAVALFFILMFVGGCSGSTSCGIKIFRFQVIFEVMRGRLLSVLNPSGVFVESYNAKPIPPQVASAVLGFFFLYLVCFAVAATLLSLIGLDVLTAISASATAISNVGPGLGPVIGPAGNFSTLPDAAKWLLALTMLVGRLELFTVMVLVLPAFWRR